MDSSSNDDNDTFDDSSEAQETLDVFPADDIDEIAAAGTVEDSADPANDSRDASSEVADVLVSDETDETVAQEHDTHTDSIFSDVPIAPGNEGLDVQAGPGWSVEYHGAMEIGDEVEQVTVNYKTDIRGDITDTLVSPGHNTKEVHDYAPRNGHDYNHDHFRGQNTDHPTHSNRGLGMTEESADFP